MAIRDRPLNAVEEPPLYLFCSSILKLDLNNGLQSSVTELVTVLSSSGIDRNTAP
jgi:hypothetical protein